MDTRVTKKLSAALLAGFAVFIASAVPAAASTPWDPTDGDLVIDVASPEDDIVIDLSTAGGGDCDLGSTPLPDSDFDFTASGGDITITDLSVWFAVEIAPGSGNWYAANVTLFPPNGGGTPHGTYSGTSASSTVSGSVRLLMSMYSVNDYPDDCQVDTLECTASAWIDIDGVYSGDIENPDSGDAFVFDAASDANQGHIDVLGCNLTYVNNFIDGQPLTGTDLTFQHT